MDLGFAGPAFTWTNKRQARLIVKENLDQVLVDFAWWLLFLDTAVLHLLPIKAPSISKIDGSSSWTSKAPFPLHGINVRVIFSTNVPNSSN